MPRRAADADCILQGCEGGLKAGWSSTTRATQTSTTPRCPCRVKAPVEPSGHSRCSLTTPRPPSPLAGPGRLPPLRPAPARTAANYNSRQPPRRPPGSTPAPPSQDSISQQPSRPPDSSFPGAAPRPWLDGGGGGRSAASGASWGRRRRERGRAGLRAVGAMLNMWKVRELVDKA